jgi:hypothetical protein
MRTISFIDRDVLWLDNISKRMKKSGGSEMKFESEI